MAAGKKSASLASVLAEVCYLYPLYLLVLAALKQPTVSFWWFLALSVAAFTANLLLGTGRLRLIAVLLINSMLAVLAACWLVYHSLSTAVPFWPLTAWAVCFISAPYGLLIPTGCWFTALIACWTWYRAAVLSRRVPTFRESAFRFDISLGMLFGILLVAAVAGISIRGGMLWIWALLLCNAAAMSLTQSLSQGEKQPAWLGPLFLAAVLAPVSLAISLFFSQTSAAGRAVYDVVVPVLGWLSEIFQSVILWIFTGRKPIVEKSGPTVSTGAAGEVADIAVPEWMIFVFKVALWVFVGLVVIILLAVFIYLLYNLLLRLWKRQEPVPAAFPERMKWLQWWHALAGILARWLNAAGRAVRPWFVVKMGHVETYHALLRWGKRRRHPRLLFETPYEYLQRLADAFPGQREDLSSITEYFVYCSYSGRPGDPHMEKKLKAALRRLSLYVFKAHFPLNNEGICRCIKKRSSIRA